MELLALLVMLYGAALVGLLGIPPGPRRKPWLTVTVCAVLSACLLLQPAIPTLLPTFERDAAEVSAGQWYRVVTALFVQDGWVSGGIFNVTLLLFLGAIAEQHLGRTLWIAIYLIGGIASELLALSWQPVGAGNSIASCALAGSLLVLSKPRGRRYLSRLVPILTVGAAAVLLAKRNIHGAAFVVGLALGAGVAVGRVFRHKACGSQ